MVKTATGLVEFAKRYVGNPYWYGTFVLPCTQSLLNAKTAQYPGHYTSGRMARYRDDIAKGKTCADCVGLIKGYGWLDPNGNIKYAINGVPDQSANGMYTAAKKKGSISTIPEVPGLAVRFDGHIGVYIGKGDVIEARGFDHGIVITKLAARPWTHWLEVPWLNYAAQSGPVNNITNIVYPLGFGERILRFGMTGEDVKALQRALIRLNYSVGVWGADGDFGAMTESAVKAYQAAKNIVQDGAVGPLTRVAMETDLPDSDATDAPDAPQQPVKGQKIVLISGGNAFIRSTPTTTGAVKGVAKEGDQFDFTGDTSLEGWQAVMYNNELSWISGKFAKPVG